MASHLCVITRNIYEKKSLKRKEEKLKIRDCYILDLGILHPLKDHSIIYIITYICKTLCKHDVKKKMTKTIEESNGNGDNVLTN